MLFDTNENKNFDGQIVQSFDFNKACEMRTDGKSYKEIAEFFGVQIETVKNHLYGHFKEDKELEAFKNNLAEHLTKKEKAILDSIDDDTIRSATLKDRILSYGIIFDKRRLEEGKSTENIAHNYGDLVERVHADRKKNRIIDAEVLE